MHDIEVVGVDHLGIVPKDLVKAKWFFGQVLGLNFEGKEEIKREGINVYFYDTQSKKKLKSCLPRFELLESLDSSSVIAQYKKKIGQGIHHVALRVENLDKIINILRENKVQILSDKAIVGAHGTKIIFVHPKSTGGILVELVEKNT